MKTKLLSLVAALLFASATLTSAATNDLSRALQKGLFEEEANHNLEAAAQAYQSVAAQFDKDRKLAATAIFRLGEVYRKQGKTNEASAQYERILREFSDQPELVKLSRNFAQATSVDATTLPQLMQMAIAAHGDYEKDQTLLDSLKKLSRADLRKSLPTLYPSSGLDNLFKKLAASQQKLASLLTGHTRDHPDVRKEQAISDLVEKQIDEKIEGIFLGLETQIASSKKRVDALAKQLRDESDKNLAAWSKNETSAGEGGWEKILAARGQTSEEEKEIQRIKAIIKDSPDLIDAQTTGLDGDVGTRLHGAAAGGHLIVAEFLLQNGADISRKSKLGKTPLYLAAENGHQAMVALLIAKGADVNAGSFSQTGAFNTIKNFSERTALHVASAQGFKTVAEVLLKNKANVNAKDRVGLTPLHQAANSGHKAVAELLLINGADVNAKDNKDETPLFSAISSKELEIARFLIAHKADANAVANEGLTPLHRAVLGQQQKLVELLLQNGANTEAKYMTGDQRGWTPLHFAASYDYQEIVEILLKSGANPNSTSHAGETPLYLAIGRSPRSAELLLANKADVNIQTKSGVTPLGIAKRHNSPTSEEFVALLLKYGANENFERITRISSMRAGKEIRVFMKGNQPLNRYTLIELILHAGYHFPDLANVKINRLEDGGNKSRIIPVNVEELLKSDDCAKNVWLEWGDVIEIPELDHRINESWFGYPKEYAETMQKCLERKVSIAVKGETTNLTLRAEIKAGVQTTDGRLLDSWRINSPNCNLANVASSHLRASSDRSRIQMKRIDPITKQSHKIIVNLETPQTPDLWLLDGDVIEVPERDSNDPTPEAKGAPSSTRRLVSPLK